MPFADLTTTGFAAKEDSKFFREEQMDPAIRKETEGGFIVTRPRFTKALPKTITTGFTDISNADKVMLENYYAQMRGGSGSFTYTHPVSGESLTVRFKSPPRFEYAGMGTNYRWNVSNIELETI